MRGGVGRGRPGGRRAIELDGKGPVYHNNLAAPLYNKNDLSGAVGEYEAATAADQKFIDGWINLGVALGKKGDHKAAVPPS